LLIVGAGVGILNTTIGAFIIPVCEDLGFTRGQFTLYASLSLITCAVLMPFYGTVINRFGFKRTALVCSVACSLVFVGFSFSSQLWHFYALAIFSGLFTNGIGVMAVGILISNWFADKKGLAIGIAYSGSGLLSAFFIPVTNAFIELYDWRLTYRYLAVVSLFIFIPVILVIIKDKPEEMGLGRYRRSAQKDNSTDKEKLNEPATGLARNEAIRTISFWLLVLTVLGIALSQAGPHVHTLSFLSDIGYSVAYASVLSSTYMILLTVGKIAIGWALDRIGSLKGCLLVGGSCVLFPIFALLSGYPGMTWLYVLLLSIASSGVTVLGPIITASLFGRKDFSRIFSLVSMFSFLGIAVSAPGLGFIYDMTDSYNMAWIIIIGIGIIVCGCSIGAFLLKKNRVEDANAPQRVK